MEVLGIRFSTTSLSVALLAGTRAAPVFTDVHTTRLPKNFTHLQTLEWIERDLTDYVKKHSPGAIVIKGAEPMASRGSSFTMRSDFEAIAMLVAARNGITCKGRTVKATLAKALFGKGKARYLTGSAPGDPLTSGGRSSEEQEAIFAAMAALS